MTFEVSRTFTVLFVSAYTIGEAAERSGFSASALRYYEDRPLAEIAALFGVNIGTVKTHLFRATHRIRKALEAIYGPRLPIS